MEYLIVDSHQVVLHDDVLSEFKQTLALQPSLYLSKVAILLLKCQVNHL